MDRPTKSDMIAGMFRAIVFVGLITSAFAGESLNELVNASASFSAAIVQQIATVQSDPSPTDFAEKTNAYAKAKMAYYQGFRMAMPELENIASGKEPRPRELDDFAKSDRIYPIISRKKCRNLQSKWHQNPDPPQ